MLESQRLSIDSSAVAKLLLKIHLVLLAIAFNTNANGAADDLLLWIPEDGNLVLMEFLLQSLQVQSSQWRKQIFWHSSLMPKLVLSMKTMSWCKNFVKQRNQRFLLPIKSMVIMMNLMHMRCGILAWESHILFLDYTVAVLVIFSTQSSPRFQR